MRLIFFSIFSLMSVSVAWAQCAGPSLGGSNPGCSIPINDPSSPYYTPDSEIPSPPPQPLGEWVKTWGAIAKDKNGLTTVSVGQSSKSEAQDKALNDCIAGGGDGCRSVFAYRNQCVAIAAGTKSSYVSTESIEKSKKEALQKCIDIGGGRCEIAYAECTEPIFKRY